MNSRNPYDLEISFDQHVWLPAPKSTYRPIVDLIEDRDVLARIIRSCLDVASEVSSHEEVMGQKILARLSPDDILLIKQKVFGGRDDVSVDAMIVQGAYVSEEIRSKMGLSIVNPPENIHRMQRGNIYVGDTYSANMVGSILKKVGIEFLSAGKYLDFGCSSGSLTRILKAAEPDSQFFGVDPIKSSIDWASKNIEGATFKVSNVEPPVDFPDGYFNGVTAISIWSHLGERRALNWFNEMHRIIADGGWLLFTSHGDTSVNVWNEREALPSRRILALTEALGNSDFVFEEVYIGESPEGLDADGYGNTYFRQSWVERRLGAKWDLSYFGKAENQNNQDVYVLTKKAATAVIRDKDLYRAAEPSFWRKVKNYF